MRHAARILLALVFGLAATGHGQDLNAEIDAFDHQIGERQIDLAALDLNSFVGKSGPPGIAVPSASPSPTNPALTRYRWTQTAMDAGREELLKSEGAPAMQQYIRAAYTRPEFDRLDRVFAQHGCVNNDVSDALSEHAPKK